jgi:hypothetical protein
MKNYIKFYNLLRLTTPTRSGVLFMLLFTILNIVVYEKFTTMSDMFTVGFAMLFIWTLFVSIYYGFLTHSNPSNPIYHFPLTVKERIKNHYISPIFMFLVVSIGLVVFGYSMVGLFSLFGNIGEDTVSDPFYLAGTIYSFGYMLIVFSLFMPSSFILDVRKRYLHGFLSIVILIVLNYLVVFVLTGSFELSWSIPIFMEQTDMGIATALVVLVVSLIAIYGSLRYSKKLTEYQ